MHQWNKDTSGPGEAKVSLHVHFHGPVEKFFTLGMLTFYTHHRQLCAVRCVLYSYPSHKNMGCPKHPLVYGFDFIKVLKERRPCKQESTAM